MPNESLRCGSPMSMEDPDDSMVTGRIGKAKMLSHISNQLVSDHAAVQEQHKSFMHKWEGLRDMLERERNRDENNSRQLKEKDAQIQRLSRTLKDRLKIIQQYRQESADQKTLLLDLEKAKEHLQDQLSSLTSKLALTESDFEAAQTRCGNAECCSLLLEDFKSRVREAEEKYEKVMTQQKHQRRKRESEHKGELALRKMEFCDLQHQLDEVKLERDTLRNKLSSEIARPAAYLREIEEVRAKFTTLEDERSELQRQLDIHRSERDSMYKRRSIQSSQIATLEHKLAVAEQALDKIRRQAEKSCEVRQYSNELRSLESIPGRLCDPSHQKFSHLTDCGRLLCGDCVAAAADACMERTFGFTAEEHFEIDQCPWCHADTWSWQQLDVPYSLTCVLEINSLWEVINSSSV